MLNTLIGGKLLKDPVAKTATNGNEYGTALIAVSNENETLVANVIAFDQTTVSKLLALRKGDPVAVVGAATVRLYTGKDGIQKPSLSVKADAILSVHEVQKRRKAQTETEPSPYILSNKAVAAMQEAGRISKANDLTVADLADDVPF